MVPQTHYSTEKGFSISSICNTIKCRVTTGAKITKVSDANQKETVVKFRKDCDAI